MPVVYGRNSMFRHMEISEQPLYEPLASKSTHRRALVLCVETGVLYKNLSRAAEDMAQAGQSTSSARYHIEKAIETGGTFMGFHWRKERA